MATRKLTLLSTGNIRKNTKNSKNSEAVKWQQDKISHLLYFFNFCYFLSLNVLLLTFNFSSGSLFFKAASSLSHVVIIH